MFPIDLYFWDNYIMFNLIALKSNPTSPRIIVAFIYSHTFNLNNFGAKMVFEWFFRIYSNDQSTLQTRTVFGISKAAACVIFKINFKITDQHIWRTHDISRYRITDIFSRASECMIKQNITIWIWLYRYPLDMPLQNERMPLESTIAAVYQNIKTSSQTQKVLISLNLIHMSVIILISSGKDNRNKRWWIQPIG